LFGSRIGRVVHVPADIEIIVVRLYDFGPIHQPGILGQLALVGEDIIDLFDIFRPELA
jgi:hypothetical protein